MNYKMNSNTHKVIDATYIPPVVQYAVPKHWDDKYIDVKQGHLFYKGERKIVPTKRNNFDINVKYYEVSELQNNGWSIEEVFNEDEYWSLDEDESDESEESEDEPEKYKEDESNSEESD